MSDIVKASELNGVAIEELFAAAYNLSFAATAWDSEPEILIEVGSHLNMESCGALVYGALRGGNCDDCAEHLLPEDKVRAAQLAARLTPEQAQWLYHFAVMVTKIA